MRRVRLGVALCAGLLVSAGALAVTMDARHAGGSASGPGVVGLTPRATATSGRPSASPSPQGSRIDEAAVGSALGVRAGAAIAKAQQRVAGAEPAKTVRYRFDSGLAEPIWDEARRLPLRQVDLHGGEVTAKRHGAGLAAGYPPPCFDAVTECPRAVLESDPAPWLNPDRRDISWGAQVLLESQNTTDGENVVQKGFSTQGTQFKLQVDHYAGVPSCVVAGLVFGINRIFVAEWRASVADGAWHRLDCVRRGARLTLFVDAKLRASTVIPSQLSIANPDPLRLGGKGVGPWNDQFHGLLDDVYVTLG